MSSQSLLSIFAGILIVALAGGWFVIDPRRPKPDSAIPMATLLTADTLNLQTQLSETDRAAAVEACITAFHNQGNDGIQHFGKPEDVARNLAQFAKASCGCLVDQLATRTSNLEFVLGMASEFSFAPRTDYARFNGPNKKRRERALPLAVTHGVSTAEFDAAGARADAAVMDAGSACMELNRNE